jgi:adenylate kinase family enzyme
MSGRIVDRVHITGASGAGTSTLGAAIAGRFGYAHLDADHYYWMPTDPPFTDKREVSERRRLLGLAMDAHPRWIVGGSLVSWGDPFIARFELVIFLYVPHDIRMARLRERELKRYGIAALAPGGGRQHEHYQEFMTWADGYDTAGDEQRSLYLHNRWLTRLPCPVVRLEGDLTTDDRVAKLADWIGAR